MRLLATLVVLLVAILVAFYFHHGGVQVADTKDDKSGSSPNIEAFVKLLDDKNFFSYINGESPNIAAYVKLLEDLRSRLASGTDAHGIAITRPAASIPLRDRFIQVQLENGAGDVITVIINTVDVYVVGYLLGPTVRQTLHYLKDKNPEALSLLLQAFPATQYTHRPLGFGGNYDSLPLRETHELGHAALNDAIRNLYYGQSQPSAILVIIQMVSEAVRIRYIEHLIRRNMLGQNLNFIPDPRAISLENEWSALSRQTQWSGDTGVFCDPVEVRSVSNDAILIRNLVELMRQAALALMLYKCNPNGRRMSVPVAVGSDEQCPYGEPTTNIIGRDGLCMDVKHSLFYDLMSVVLMKCGKAKRNQLWTFKSDGTIRTNNGKCLATYGYTPGSYIMIYNCETYILDPDNNKWILYNSGTIMNPKSGRVIAAESSTQGTVLTLAEDNNYSVQAWSAGNYTKHPINYISGFREMCLQANGVYGRVWLENCTIGTEHTQQWALYGDGTIRLYSDTTLCVTSEGHDSSSSIVLLKCQGGEHQRWTFMADGTILNPNARLVMDVRRSDVSLHEIILFRPTGNPNQKWLAF